MDEMFCLACAQLTPCAVPARGEKTSGGSQIYRTYAYRYCLCVPSPVARDTRHSSCTWFLLLFSISEFVDWGYRASGRTLFMIQFVEVNACRTSEDDNNARKGHAGQKANRQLTNKAHERRALGPSAVSVSSAMHASWRLAD